MHCKAAPIAYFAFNRPSHTLQSLNAIKSSPLSENSEIYIFCDGPRFSETPEGLRNIEAVRSVARSKQWCRDVHFNFSENNKGVFKSITEGVTEVVNKHGRVIVIEDDVVICPAFLAFANDALEMYQNDEEVMHISGFSPLGDLPCLITDSSFFYNHTFCGYGWATWKRAWQHFNPNGYDLMKQIDKSGKRAYINLDQNFEIYWGLKYIHEGRFPDWNYNWHTSVALRNGLCLQPAKSLANNIGFDGSGMHCTPEMAPPMDYEILDRIQLERISLIENTSIRRILHKRPLKTKALFLLKHYLRFVLMKKFKSQ